MFGSFNVVAKYFLLLLLFFILLLQEQAFSCFKETIPAIEKHIFLSPIFFFKLHIHTLYKN